MGAAVEGGRGGGPRGSPGAFCPVTISVTVEVPEPVSADTGVCAGLPIECRDPNPLSGMCGGLLWFVCMGDTTFDNPVVPGALCWLE